MYSLTSTVYTIGGKSQVKSYNKCSRVFVPVNLLHLGHGDIEWLTASVQDVASSCQVDVRAVHDEWVALSHVALQAVEGTVLGDLHTTQTQSTSLR